MSYRITFTPQAEAEVQRLYVPLAQRSPGLADRWYESYSRAIERVRIHPLTCGLAYESAAFPEEVRHLLFGSKGRRYRALFVVRGDEVVVVAIRAPGERPISPSDFDEPY